MEELDHSHEFEKTLQYLLDGTHNGNNGMWYMVNLETGAKMPAQQWLSSRQDNVNMALLFEQLEHDGLTLLAPREYHPAIQVAIDIYGGYEWMDKDEIEGLCHKLQADGLLLPLFGEKVDRLSLVPDGGMPFMDMLALIFFAVEPDTEEPRIVVEKGDAIEDPLRSP